MLSLEQYNVGSITVLSKEIEEAIQRKYEQLAPYLNESSLRMWAASEALSWGHGGITSVSRATGLLLCFEAGNWEYSLGVVGFRGRAEMTPEYGYNNGLKNVGSRTYGFS